MHDILLLMILQTIKQQKQIWTLKKTKKPNLVLLSFDMFEHGKG